MDPKIRKKLIHMNTTMLTYLLSDLDDEGEKQERRYRVSPYLSQRDVKGRFISDFEDLYNDGNLFMENFHMSVDSFDILYGMVEPYLLPKAFIRKDIIPPKAKLAIVLEFLASGDLQRHISSIYRIRKQHFGKIIDEVSEAIIDVLSNEIPEWTVDNIKNVANKFEKKCNIPNCAGALDGKHVPIKAPPNSGSLFYNYKGHFSIVILAVCDADSRFTYLDIGAYGSEGDANVFRNSSFGTKLLQDSLPFPEDEMVGGTKLPFFIAADDAFPLHKRIMKPFAGKELNNEERIFNYRLSRARINIEHAFGIISWRWLCLQKKLFCKPDRAQKIVTVCCLLHNYLMNKDREIYIEGFLQNQDFGENFISLNNFGGRSADFPKFIRNTLKDFVNSPSGSLPWQKKAAGIK